MKKLLLTVAGIALWASLAHGVGRIQDADMKTLAEVGGVASRLTNSSKVYDSGLAKQLSTAITDGSIGTNIPDLLNLSGMLASPTMVQFTNQGSTPATPASGKSRVYTKTDKKLYVLDDTGAETPVGSGAAVTGYQNLLSNPDWETNTTGWTASAGTYTRTTTAANVGYGTGAASWVPNAASDTLSSSSIAIPSGFYGQNGELSCLVKTSGLLHKLQVYDGSNVIAATDVITTASSYQRVTLNFVFPSSGNIVARALSGDTATLYLDECYLGPARNIGTVAQSYVVGTANWPGTTSCQWNVSSSTPASFPADTDCTNPTVTGKAAAPGTKIPAVVFSNLEPGDYILRANGGFFRNNASNTCLFQLYDGTTAGQNHYVTGLNGDYSPTLIQKFSYTTGQASRTFEVRANAVGAAQQCSIDNDASGQIQLYFELVKVPTLLQQAASVDSTPMSWSGYHDSTCIWKKTSATSTPSDYAADGSCALVEATNTNFGTVTGSNTGPQITFTPKKTGTLSVCSIGASNDDTTPATFYNRLTDGTTVIAEQSDYSYGITALCGLYRITSLSPVTLKWQVAQAAGSHTMSLGTFTGSSRSIDWSIVDVSQSVAAPILVGSVTSNTSGTERIERALIANNGSTCSVTSQSGSWLGSPTRNGAGDCTLAINSGMFSAAPICTVEAQATNAAINAIMTKISTDSGPSTSQVRVTTANTSGTLSDYAFNIICMGPR